MPSFIAMIMGALLRVAGSLVGQVLLALGLTVVTYSGMDTALDWLKSQAVSSFHGLPAEVLGLLGLMKVGSSISIVFSAMLARMAVQGVVNGSFKKWVLK